MPDTIKFGRDNSRPPEPPDDDEQFIQRLNQETLVLLLDKIAKATPAQRLTLLSLIEHPDALQAVEQFWTAAKGSN